MKTSLKILAFVVAMAAMTACSAQKRAERHIRKAVELCPSLVQVKAHAIDTVLTVPGFADCVKLPLSELLAEDTLYAATDHGTVMAHLDLKDRTIRIGFIATPRELHFRDTINYAEVTLVEPTTEKKSTFWHDIKTGFFSVLAVFLIGIILRILKNHKNHKK